MEIHHSNSECSPIRSPKSLSRCRPNESEEASPKRRKHTYINFENSSNDPIRLERECFRIRMERGFGKAPSNPRTIPMPMPSQTR